MGLSKFFVSGLSVLTRRKNCHVGLGHFARIVSFPLKGKSNNNFSVQDKIFTLWSGGTTSKFAASVSRVFCNQIVASLIRPDLALDSLFA